MKPSKLKFFLVFLLIFFVSIEMHANDFKKGSNWKLVELECFDDEVCKSELAKIKLPIDVEAKDLHVRFPWFYGQARIEKLISIKETDNILSEKFNLIFFSCHWLIR